MANKTARFIFYRKLIVCKRCRTDCRCKGAGFYYSIHKRHEALNRDAVKIADYKSIDVGGFESP